MDDVTMLTPDAIQPAAIYVAIAELKPWIGNPRKNDPAVQAVMDSIRRFGFGSPILARKANGEVIAGHTRLKAAAKLGLIEVPVRYLDLSESEAHALALADNRVGEIAEWDDAALADILHELDDSDVSLDGLGWTGDELETLLVGSGGDSEDEDEDEVPEVDDGPTDSQNGGLYELGPHRLLCGSCREPADVACLLGARQINLAFTSPPYASQREYDPSSGFRPIPAAEYVEWFDAVQSLVKEYLSPDGSWFVNIKEASEDGCKQDYVKRLTLRHIDDWDWRWIEEYCWPRPALPLNPNDSRRFKNGWESVYHFVKDVRFKFHPDRVRHESDAVFIYEDQKAAGKMVGGNGQGVGGGIMSPVGTHAGLAFPSNVLKDCSGGARIVGHSAAFPVGLPSFFIQAFSDDADTVYDPFMGSGTTLIAAAKHGRIAYGTEISAKYCDVIRRRWTRWALVNNQDPGPGALDG